MTRAGGGTAPAVSVIIPTHERRETLGAALDALGAQRFALDRMEVVVVADGCTDGTAAMVRGYRAPFALTLVEQAASGAAHARNAGAAAARAPLLLFLDDDIIAEPGLVAAHVRAHTRAPGRAVMGYSRPTLGGPRGYFRAGWRQWWEDEFREMGSPGHRFTYRDLLSGNFSIAAALFAAAGGFDERVEVREDYELGFRLIDAGVALAFEPAAAGEHLDHGTMRRALGRVRGEGRGDVQIGMRHPELRPRMQLARFEAPVKRLDRRLRRMAFGAPRLGDLVAAALTSLLGLLERLRLRRRWQRLHGAVRGYWYWRGVAEQIGSRRALAAFVQGGAAVVAGEWGGRPLEVELQEGLPHAERTIDAARPAGVRLRYAGVAVGEIAAVPGAERLRGAHLRPALADDPVAWPLVMAMTFAGAASPSRPSLHMTPASESGRAPSFAAD